MLSKAIDYICELNWLLTEISTDQTLNTRCQHWKTLHSKSSRKIAKAHQSKPARGSPLSLTPIARAVDHTNNCILSCMISLSENENFILLPNTFSLKKKVKIRWTPKPCNKIYGFVQKGTITVLVSHTVVEKK